MQIFMKTVVMLTKILKLYPLTVILTAVIWMLCLFSPPETRLSEIAFIDKWTHLVMYGGLCCIIWLEFLRSRRPLRKQTLLFTFIFPVLMSGIIEVVQEYCTTTRSGEWADLAANIFGVILGNAAGFWLVRPLVRRYQLKKKEKHLRF